MKKRIYKYVKHIVVSFLIIGIAIALFGLYHGASIRYGENPVMMNWDKDGPYAFYTNDSSISVNHIRGSQKLGFYVEHQKHNSNSVIWTYCYFPLDSTSFEFPINTKPETPVSEYKSGGKILAISDIESSYKTFRDFLINNQVIDKHLNWIFGNGHLVLLGDFVDREFSTTQVLWFVYKLEQDARQKGGTVHFILGNHELKNMQGNYESSSPKYFHVAAILEKQQSELYDTSSVLGRWMASKNIIESINGVLFTHGGIQPALADEAISLSKINEIVRRNYYKPYYPRPVKNIEQSLISSHNGIAWYRGYFKDHLAQTEVDRMLNKFNAKAIVVGHTLQSKVNRLFNGKVVGIDVKHPRDYSKSFPNQQSEGLLIDNGKYYRALHNGKKKEI